MAWKYLLPLVALAGVAIGAYVVSVTNRDVAPVPATDLPAHAPYSSSVSGSGIVEAGSQNVSVVAPEAGIVTRVLVKPGDNVAAGAPLVQLDDRLMAASIYQQQAVVTGDEAAVRVAQAQFDAAKEQAALLESIAGTRPSALPTAQELARYHSDMTIAQARIDQTTAELTAARIQLATLQGEREAMTIRSPLAGQVLHMDARVGEWIGGGSGAAPLAVVGDVTQLRVRVDVDENEAWRVRPGAAAEGSVRGNPNVRTPLQFDYVEPMVLPKHSLTGDSAERVDTRVLEIVYTFRRNDLPIYVGQQMDVSIDATGAQTQPAGDVPAGPATRVSR